MERILSGSKCVVTGASRGIGRAIALSLAKQGADILITYVNNEKKAKETIGEIKKMGVKAYALKCDAESEDDIQKLAQYVEKVFGNITVLINNAGTIGEEKPVTEVSSEEWDKIMRIDVRGVILTIKYLLPIFDKEKTGKIINISSELSIKGRANYLPYTTAKGAVNSMTRSLALELAPNILVNTIAPGPVETDMIMEDMNEEWIEKEKNIPLKRLGNVTEIAASVVLLASKYGDFYCGQFISPNGGAVFI